MSSCSGDNTAQAWYFMLLTCKTFHCSLFNVLFKDFLEARPLMTRTLSRWEMFYVSSERACEVFMFMCVFVRTRRKSALTMKKNKNVYGYMAMFRVSPFPGNWWKYSMALPRSNMVFKKLVFTFLKRIGKLLPVYTQSFFCIAVLTPQHYHWYAATRFAFPGGYIAKWTKAGN